MVRAQRRRRESGTESPDIRRRSDLSQGSSGWRSCGGPAWSRFHAGHGATDGAAQPPGRCARDPAIGRRRERFADSVSRSQRSICNATGSSNGAAASRRSFRGTISADRLIECARSGGGRFPQRADRFQGTGSGRFECWFCARGYSSCAEARHSSSTKFHGRFAVAFERIGSATICKSSRSQAVRAEIRGCGAARGSYYNAGHNTAPNVPSICSESDVANDNSKL